MVEVDVMVASLVAARVISVSIVVVVLLALVGTADRANVAVVEEEVDLEAEEDKDTAELVLSVELDILLDTKLSSAADVLTAAAATPSKAVIVVSLVTDVVLVPLLESVEYDPLVEETDASAVELSELVLL